MEKELTENSRSAIVAVTEKYGDLMNEITAEKDKAITQVTATLATFLTFSRVHKCAFQCLTSLHDFESIFFDSKNHSLSKDISTISSYPKNLLRYNDFCKTFQG